MTRCLTVSSETSVGHNVNLVRNLEITFILLNFCNLTFLLQVSNKKKLEFLSITKKYKLS